MGPVLPPVGIAGEKAVEFGNALGHFDLSGLGEKGEWGRDRGVE